MNNARPMQGLELTVLRRVLISSTVLAANDRNSAEKASMLAGRLDMAAVAPFKGFTGSSVQG